MKFKSKFFAILLAILFAQTMEASVTLLHKDATVWSHEQVIRGKISSPFASNGMLYVNGIAFPFSISADSFATTVQLKEGLNYIIAAVDTTTHTQVSDTLRFTLGYRLKPIVDIYPTVDDRNVTLHATIIENPDSSAISYNWWEETDNPALFAIGNHNDSVASLSIPLGSPLGEYYFNLTVIASDGDTSHARTFVTVDSTGIRPFNMRTDHAQWIDSAIIYGITPYIFVANGKFNHITAKIPELKDLGVNTLWIQPTYATRGGGQGYDVINYFAIRTDLGTENDLHTLVETAHANGLRVLFDFVPNHTSLYHPYAQNAIQYGVESHYYDFYQRAVSSAPYSGDEHNRTNGKMTFVYYFWNELVNLNYDNPEVRRMMIEAGKYWIEKFDIDGYRIDAVWGPNARRPDFMKEWRLALKRLKPEILLLGEDKASQPQAFDEKFDAAYDWTPEYSWVSHWSWQTFYSANSNPTIFNNTPENQRAAKLRSALNNNGAGYAPEAKVFHFMENNDTYRFLNTHDLARTKMAAAMMFTLDGIPSIFNGQEIGAATHPYSTFQIFQSGNSIRSLDTRDLFPYYQTLNRMRTMFPALYGRNFAEVGVTPNAAVFAYRRWQGAQNLFTVMNMAAGSANVSMRIPVSSLSLDPTKTYYLSDLLSATVIAGTPDELDTVSIAMSGYSTRVFILADNMVTITDVQIASDNERPKEFELSQNYPNPFNPGTEIQYRISDMGVAVLKVYDVLGREVATLVNEELAPGSYSAFWNASEFPSGVYFYRLRAGKFAETHSMILLK